MELFKKKVQIPEKKSMNLYQEKQERNEIPELVIGIVIVLVLTVVMSQFILVSRLNKMNALESEVDALQAQYDSEIAYLEGYSDLRMEYLRYSNAAIEEAIKLADRMDILKLLSDSMNGYGYINSVDILGNQVSLSVVTKDLDSLNVVIKRLEQSGMTSRVTVYEADYDDDGLTSAVVFNVLVEEEQQ